MEQTFEELFESSQYNQNIKPGQIIEANVINITADHAVLSAGLKSESFVNINQFKDSDGEIEVNIGDTVKVVIEEIEDGEGQTKLSRQKAKNEATWSKLISATETGEIITGLIQNRIKGGFMVLIDDVTAFLPGSLVDVRPVRETQYLEGTVSEFKVVKADKSSNNIVVSRKAALLGDSEENRGEMLGGGRLGDAQVLREAAAKVSEEWAKQMYGQKLRGASQQMTERTSSAANSQVVTPQLGSLNRGRNQNLYMSASQQLAGKPVTDQGKTLITKTQEHQSSQ